MTSRLSIPRAVTIAVGVLALLLSPSRSHAATSEQVEAALQKAKEGLYAKMDKEKFWEEVPKKDPMDNGNASTKGRQFGGLTSIAVYALLASGENHQDAKLKPAIDWVKKQDIIGNYALGLRAQIWPFLPNTPEVRQLALKDREYFYKGLHQVAVSAKKADADRIGFYPYWFDNNPRKMHPGDNHWDLSISQYGVLGMWACNQVEGVEGAPGEYWAIVDKAWKNAQFKEGPDSGGWAYQRGGKNVDHEKVKGTMTAAGVATLFITQDYLLSYTKFDVCKGGANNPWIDAGLIWMDKHIEELLKGNHYGMYGVERIGVASGKKYFGIVDWYQVGADYLVKTQGKDGSWGGNVPNTCFAMLFLSRGRAPVVMNKLEYSLNDPNNAKIKLPWAQRPRDVANFAKFAGKQVEQFFNWQVVNLKVAPDDLHDAPILYISGSLPLDFTDAEIVKLREYCEAGGLILFNADCADPNFVQSVIGPKGIGRKMFPKYEFRDLPASHPIYTEEVYQAKNWATKPRLIGMSNGVRELMLIVPEADLGRAWQTRSEKTKAEDYQLGINLFFYAAEKGNVRLRGDTHIVNPNPKIQDVVKIKVARIMAGDNPDPEPYGWKRLGAILHNTAQVGVTPEPVTLGQGKLVAGPTGYQLAHWTGTTKFKLTPQQEDEIKKYVTAGGTLLIDAAGGSSDFAEAAEQALAKIFGGDPKAVGPILAPDEQPYTWTGFKIARFDYRKFARSRLSGKLATPRVRGIDQGGKTRIFYSREDLTGGLLGQPCDGIIGYDPATATAIARNIALYAAFNGRPPKPATRPATAPTAEAK